jgi:hypothetical protein
VKVGRLDRDPSIVEFRKHIWARRIFWQNLSTVDAKRFEKLTNLFNGSLFLVAHLKP